MAKYKKRVQPLGPDKKIRVLRQFNPYAYKTTQGGPAVHFGQSIEKSRTQLALKPTVVRSKRPVKRLYQKDPYNMNSVTGIRATGRTQATFAPEQDTYTTNPNPKFNPSRGPGVVVLSGQRDVTMEKPGKASRGHQRVVKRTLFNQNQGKRLRRV